ncbi:MAG: hypothetical protein WCI18_16115 [Pseudomonadota bacterium]
MKSTISTLYTTGIFLAFFGCNSRPENPMGASPNNNGSGFKTTGSPGSGDAGGQDDCQKNNCQPLNLVAQIGGNAHTAQDGRQSYWFSDVNRAANWLVSISGAPAGRPLRVFTNLSGAKMKQQGYTNTWLVDWVPTKAKQDNLEVYARDLKRCQMSAPAGTDCNADQYNSTYDFKAKIAYFVEKLTQGTDQNGNVFCTIGAVVGTISNSSTTINNSTGGIGGAIASGLSQSGTCDNLRNYTAKPVTTSPSNGTTNGVLNSSGVNYDPNSPFTYQSNTTFPNGVLDSSGVTFDPNIPFKY